MKSRVSVIVASLLLLVFSLPFPAFGQQEEPYSGGEVTETTAAVQIAALVEGLTVTLSVSGVSQPCTWDFGDGTSGEGNPVEHTYAEAGTYDVTATCGTVVAVRGVQVGALPFTGANIARWVAWGVILVAAGVVVVWLFRRRRTSTPVG